MLQAVADKCFTACVTKPGTRISRSEGNCVSNCMERYIEATRIISRAVLNSQP
ncbi:hypothetical protein PR202_gb14591 [Eleusine coracana subsp. coracana]|uniref:Mitochondrial import inner membrane translocase subunit n=1 Tax=Eleusine coracana subsp. coracana TaxID=191504 RepID=A0AAV5EV00_ELECO|nr:hypothetical protein PR202_gb14591 [Eleusine coracana subsp. coracana]